MSKKSIVETVTEIVLPITAQLGLELVDVEYVKEGSSWYLRIYIDKENGINIDDCQSVSEKVSDILDERDPIPNSYILEVSSPGLDRPLKTERDFEKYKGELVEVKLFKAIDKTQMFEGTLLEKSNNQVVIDIDGNITKFDMKDIAVIRRLIKF
jgi:ribosome maturation factor RimP